MALSTADIANLAAKYWTGDNVAIAVAVAQAESGGNPTARGDTSLQTAQWGPSIGLWQIRSLNSQKGSGGTRDESANTNPDTNAKHAHEIWAGSGWGAWSAYTNGAYKMYLPEAKAVVGNTAPSATNAQTNPTPEQTSALTTAGFLQNLSSPNFWFRALKVIAGGALILGTAYVIARPVVAPVVEPVVKGAAKAATVL